MPWKLAAFYEGSDDHDVNGGATLIGVQDDNHVLVPALILWSLVTMNTAGQYCKNAPVVAETADPSAGPRQVTAKEKGALATALGCTLSTVQGFFDLAQSEKYKDAFNTVAHAFEQISRPAATGGGGPGGTPLPAPYNLPYCPSTASPMLKIAQLWQQYLASLPKP